MLPLLQPPLITLPCFERPDPARHLHQLVRHGVAGCNSGRRPGLLHQQLLAVLQRRYAAFELPELIPHGCEALNELCDILEQVFDAAGELPDAAEDGYAMPSGGLRYPGGVDAKAVQDGVQPRRQIGLTGVEVLSHASKRASSDGFFACCGARSGVVGRLVAMAVSLVLRPAYRAPRTRSKGPRGLVASCGRWDSLKPFGCGFSSPKLGGAVPYGVSNITGNNGWVSAGVDHDTANFAVNAICSWWRMTGRARDPDACNLYIRADCGGSNRADPHIPSGLPSCTSGGDRR